MYLLPSPKIVWDSCGAAIDSLQACATEGVKGKPNFDPVAIPTLVVTSTAITKLLPSTCKPNFIELTPLVDLSTCSCLSFQLVVDGIDGIEANKMLRKPSVVRHGAQRERELKFIA